MQPTFNPLILLAIVAAVGLATSLPWAAFWLMCRLMAERCPRCKSKWRTELHSEWECELWQCHACKNTWFVERSRAR